MKSGTDTVGKIFGYDFEDILRAQQRGGTLSRKIDTSVPPTCDMSILPEDIKMLEQHGEEKLREMGYFGCLDRLEKAGMLN